jgi:hypothetical protein
VHGAAVADVKESEIRVGEGGGEDETEHGETQAAAGEATRGQGDEDAGERDEEDETGGAESLVGIQGDQKERMRRSTRSS